MIRRVIAALVAVVLAAIGIVLVVNYANGADQRALADQETVDVLVATEAIAQGDSDDLASVVEVRQIPRAYVVPGALDSVEDLDGLVAASDLVAGEQILEASFVTREELRSQGTFVVPEEAQDLHQLTINLSNPRALGGSIAAGDTVGLFGTFEMEPPSGWAIGPNGELLWDPDVARENDFDGGGGVDGTGESDNESSDSDDTITFTDLVLDKVLVVRVEGGSVQGGPETEEGGQAQDTIHVTLALDPQDAAQVIQTMETASVWLTYIPEGAEDAEVKAVVPALPSRVTGVVE